MMKKTDALYPPIEPYETGELLVGDGHRVYWEVSGNPEGKPVVFLHGGPGSGTSPWQRQFFDPKRYRIVLLDQRGCGKSTPHASAPDADFRHITTAHLIADIELLRKNLGIARWQVFGGSWGSALALAYAQAHPDAVTELVLRGIFTLRRVELEWFYEGGAAALFPDLWESFIAPIPLLERSHMIEAYHRRLFDPDPRRARAGGGRLGDLGGVDRHADAERCADRGDVRPGEGHRFRSHREPLLRPSRLVGRGTADRRRRRHPSHPDRHRAGAA